MTAVEGQIKIGTGTVGTTRTAIERRTAGMTGIDGDMGVMEDVIGTVMTGTEIGIETETGTGIATVTVTVVMIAIGDEAEADMGQAGDAEVTGNEEEEETTGPRTR